MKGKTEGRILLPPGKNDGIIIVLNLGRKKRQKEDI